VRVCSQALRPYSQRNALTRLPSLLEWGSYLAGAGNLLAGPFMELRDYQDYVDRKVGG
jgi:hypothetical protein